MSSVRNFVGMAAAVLLVGAASLAQAQTGLYWTNNGTAAWSGSANWTPGTFLGSNAPSGDCPSYIAGGTVINNGGTANIAAGDNVTDISTAYGARMGSSLSAAATFSAAAVGMDMST